ncbi:hypothetical protein L3Q82_020016 [Scortum barcoo]|uniref:Uncharacterized protein n=1 Tax=Scortum barcoo TaxID=214431 RepID=A0ACB8VDP1_9TELE|nr:hypothetical protein L3Q82_020016 [Scortum barcoo]
MEEQFTCYNSDCHSSAGAGEESNSPPVLYRGRAEVSQQLQSSWSSFLRLGQEWRETHMGGEIYS